jgi:hypothetical protein
MASGNAEPGLPAAFHARRAFRTAIRKINETKAGFEKLAAQSQDAYLDSLQKGNVDLGGVPSGSKSGATP